MRSYFLLRIMWFLVGILFISSSVAAQTCVQSPSGLVSWWPAEGNANDISNGNNGALVGGTTFSPGKVGQAFKFDGTTGYVQVPHNANLNIGSAFTIEFWLNENPVQEGDEVGGDGFGIMGKITDIPPGGWPIGWLIEERSWGQLDVYLSGSSTISPEVLRSLNGLSYRDGGWHHVAVVYDGITLKGFRLYVDGMDHGARGFSGLLNPNTAPLLIGKRPFGSYRYLRGMVDELTIYNRALITAEINAIYSAGSLGKCKTSCSDTIQNQKESDVDCGGPCVAQGKACTDGKKCTINDDCTSKSCTYQFITKWGTAGAGDGQFSAPYGLIVDSADNVYVSDISYDPRKDTIQKFSSSGQFLAKYMGSNGAVDGLFSSPINKAIDSTGNVYVAEAGNHRIQKFSSTGQFITKWGSYGTSDGKLYSPVGIAIDSTGNVYVTEAGNHRIQKFSSTGQFITKWGSYGTGDGQFSSPRGIGIDSTGNVYVAEVDNKRIQKFGPACISPLPPPCTDSDSDGYGKGGTDLRLCLTSFTDGDCSDDPLQDALAAAIHPGAPEICNSKDDNCNGQIDEGISNCCTGKLCQIGETCQNNVCTPTTGTINIDTKTAGVSAKEGTTVLGTTNAQGQLSISHSAGNPTQVFSKAGYKDVTKTVTVTTGQTTTLLFTYCTDADGDKYGVGEGCLGADCDDGNAGLAVTCTGTVTITLTGGAEVQVKEGANVLGTTSSQGMLSISLLPGSHTITFTKSGYNDIFKPVTVKAGETISLSFTYCLDLDNDRYGTGEGCQDRDCNDDPADGHAKDIHPGATEICGDGLDNDCTDGVDYDGASYFPTKKGAANCAVTVTDKTVSPIDPVEESDVSVGCISSVANVRSIKAFIDSSECPFKQWNGNTANFFCPTGIYAEATKTKVITCKVDTSISFTDGEDKTATITIRPSECTKYSQGRCLTETTRCQWVEECSGGKWSGGTARCVSRPAPVPQCSFGKCGADCDKTNTAWIKLLTCYNTCQDSFTLLKSKTTLQTECDYDVCKKKEPLCPTSGESLSCSTIKCDPDGTKHLMQKECRSPCVTANGADATCGTCTLDCNECALIYYNADGNWNNGCECVKSNNGIEICDGKDNDCNGQVDDSIVSQSCYTYNGPLSGTKDRLPCKSGMSSCANGVSRCVGEVTPQQEVCDGRDNDCDGVVDNGRSAAIEGSVENETNHPVKDVEVSIQSPRLNLVPTTKTTGDGKYVISPGERTGMFTLFYDHPHYKIAKQTVNVENLCATASAPKITLTLCGNGRADPGETCSTCAEDIKCGLGMVCDNNPNSALAKCVDTCPQNTVCTPNCPTGLIGRDGQCVCNTIIDGTCGCDFYCINNPTSDDCNTCLRVCGNPASREADPDCVSKGLVLTNQKVTVDVPAENIITQEKVVMYKGKPVKVKIVIWGKTK